MQKKCDLCCSDNVRHAGSLLCVTCFEGISRLFWLHLHHHLLQHRLDGVVKVQLVELKITRAELGLKAAAIGGWR